MDLKQTNQIVWVLEKLTFGWFRRAFLSIFGWPDTTVDPGTITVGIWEGIWH
jgi:hypothetical protein